MTTKIGLALGGGGARGLAHIGILKVLQREQIPIDVISGTSMGGIVGAMHAVGKSTEEMEAVALKHGEISQIFKLIDLRLLGSGLLGGKRIKKLLVEVLGAETTFADLRIPFAVVAVDYNSGREVVLNDGNLADAVRATMSVPGVFEPVDLGGYKLLDGGVLDNVPVGVAREHGRGESDRGGCAAQLPLERARPGTDRATVKDQAHAQSLSAVVARRISDDRGADGIPPERIRARRDHSPQSAGGYGFAAEFRSAAGSDRMRRARRRGCPAADSRAAVVDIVVRYNALNPHDDLRLSVSASASVGQSEKRLYYLDWLRVFIIGGVFLAHAVLPFTGGDWLIVSGSLIPIAGAIAIIGNQFGMPLLFVISGAATVFSMRRRTNKQYARERFFRLIIPYIVLTLILSPMQAYYQALDHGWYSGSFIGYLPEFFNLNGFTGFDLQWAGRYGFHLWFLVFLFFYSIVTIPLFTYLRSEKGKRWFELFDRLFRLPGAIVWIPGAIMGVITGVVYAFFPGYQNWGDTVYWGLFFVYGYILYSDPRLLERVRRSTKAGVLWIVLSVVALVVVALATLLSIGQISNLNRSASCPRSASRS